MTSPAEQWFQRCGFQNLRLSIAKNSEPKDRRHTSSQIVRQPQGNAKVQEGARRPIARDTITKDGKADDFLAELKYFSLRTTFIAPR